MKAVFTSYEMIPNKDSVSGGVTTAAFVKEEVGRMGVGVRGKVRTAYLKMISSAKESLAGQ